MADAVAMDAAAMAAPVESSAPFTQQQSHPYYPPSVQLPGEYASPTLPFELVLAYFFSACGVVVLGAWLYSGRHKYLGTQERLLACWFLCTGLIHLVIEGDVVLFPRFYENRSPRHLLHEIWKEYSKADSRYATRDDFTVSMEAVTAFCWGPLCLALFPAILHRKSWRFAGIAIASLGQIYGDVLYFGTCLHGGGDVGWEAFSKHSRPEALYFWFYFVVINSVWLVIPGMCLVYAVRKINAAVASVERPPARKRR